MKRFLFLALLICLFGSPASAANHPAPQVVVSIKPLYSLVAGLMQGVGKPQLLIKGGASPHGYSLRPSEAAALADAQLIVWVGPGLEGFLEKTLDGLSPTTMQLELSQRLQPYLLPARSGGTWEKHDHHDEAEHHHDEVEHHHDEAEHHHDEAEHHHDEAEHHHDEAEHHHDEAEHHHDEAEHHHDEAEHHHDEAEHLHDEAEHHHDEAEHHHDEAEHHHHDEADLEHFDPHIWLSPAMAAKIVVLCEDALIDIDPAHKDEYQANAIQLLERIKNLDNELTRKLAPVKDVPYIVFHAAYQYFETAYGLNAVGSVTISPERKPGVKRVLEIREKIKTLHARCVFSEPQFQSKLVNTIIEGTDTRTGILDPLGADLPADQDAYFVLLKRLADNLYQGLH